jgi:hypothetical protein
MLSSGSQKIQLESGLPSKPHYPLLQKDLPNSGTGQCQILDWLLAKRGIGSVEDQSILEKMHGKPQACKRTNP